MEQNTSLSRPRYAAVDIGSNTVKLTIVERDGSGELTPVLDVGVTTRIGEGIRHRLLGEEPMRRTLDALERFMAACVEHGVERIIAVGTSALRDAANRDEFLHRAMAIGVSVSVLSGDEEAAFSALAVRRDPLWRDCARVAVVDIGGGSTEIICDERDRSDARAAASLQLGAVRLTEAALASDPPTADEVRAAIEVADQALAPIARGGADDSLTVVGVGGTVVNMAAVMGPAKQERCGDGLHGAVLTRSEIARQMALYAGMTLEQRKAVPGLDPARADVILGGAIILSRVLVALGRDEAAVCCRGLRWGVLYDRLGV
jgi:exopolyphosphatase/guanosine-5'-triphosphate,3'-diphosphate pyrophosphatase